MSINTINRISYPLSPTQEGMLFDRLFGQQAGVHIEQIHCTLYEALDVAAFHDAWLHFISRHDVLRTTFRWEGLDRPLQDVHSKISVPLEQHDWRHLSELEQLAGVQIYLRKDREKGFDLTQPPLLRLALFRLGEMHYQLVWTFYHGLLDGRSFPLALQEVFALYETSLRGGIPTQEERVPYQRFIEWTQQQDRAGSEVFWRQKLHGFSAPTPILHALAPNTVPEDMPIYGEQERELPAALVRDLKAFAEQNNLTLNTLFQGAWGLLLSRYSGEEEVVFGAVRACRHSSIPQAETMLGVFINTLPLRVSMSPEKPLLTWLREIRDQQLELRQYEHTPLVKVQQWSDVGAGMPLFESILIYDNSLLGPMLQEQGGSWSQRNFVLHDQTNYPMTLRAHYYGSEAPRFLLNARYYRDRFADETVQQMLGHVETVLENMVHTTDQQLSSLDSLSASERQQLLVTWNATQADYAKDRCIHQLFEEQASKTADAIAVVFQNQKLTYRDLNARANQLARYLQKLGVGPEQKVGICTERSLDMVVAILAVLKAGGAYIPLDPTYPRDRLDFMLRDSALTVLLSHSHLGHQFPDYQGKLVLLDRDWPAIANSGDENLGVDVAPPNLAYLIYTSGSTGKPKGVMVEHRNVVNFFTGMDARIEHQVGDTWLAVTSLSFDISVLELLWTLTRGFKVVLYVDETHARSSVEPGNQDVLRPREVYPIRRLIKEHAVSHLQCTPSMATMLTVNDDNHAVLGTLKYVFLGGEALPSALVARLRELTPAQLQNMYGPTETTIWSTTYPVTHASGTIPIGRPIANTQIYIVDSTLHPVPVGVTGELLIGGDGVVRGYLNRDELTRERFIPDPFSSNPRARLYRTGDLARYQGDGNIEFLGRADHQVKVRGYRIELGEIEAVLTAHPAVQEAVVIAREDSPGDKRLVAYLVVTGEPPSVREFRERLQEKLPDYMVPSHFVFLRQLPLTPNAKVDRKALPAPTQVEAKAARAYEPPENDFERSIATIWKEVLNIQSVGRQDNFFDLGGHSLHLMRVHSRLCDVISQQLSMTDLFRFPTLRSLAEYLSNETEKNVALDTRRDPVNSKKEAMGQRRPLKKQTDPSEWTYQPVWREASVSRHDAGDQSGQAQDATGRVLVFFDATVACNREFLRVLRDTGREVLSVQAGDSFYRLSATEYTIAPERREDYAHLLEDLRAREKFPERIVHLWLVTEDETARPGSSFFHRNQERGFYSLLYLAQALGHTQRAKPLLISVVSNGMQQVAKEAVPYPEKATVLGPCKVMPREYPGVLCKSIDIVPTEFLRRPWHSRARWQGTETLRRQLIQDVLTEGCEVVAYREGARWVQAYEKVRLQAHAEAGGRLREGGVYLITGGLGGLGLVLAEYLAQKVKARLVLLGRTPLPDREQWKKWLESHRSSNPTSYKLRKIMELEALGAEVLPVATDVANIEQMQRVIAEVVERFGCLHGVIHAAGIVADGVMQLRTQADVEQVFSAKVHGTMLLDTLLKDQPLDFFVLCSSTSSILGPAGQVDYSAANAFLNAFAQSRSHTPKPYVVAINWGLWQDVGMAARAFEDPSQEEKPTDHPLLERCVVDTEDEIVYASGYSPETHWGLDQRRTKGGAAIVPSANLSPVAHELHQLLQEGIRPAEGSQVLDTILASRALPQMVVSSLDLHDLLQHEGCRQTTPEDSTAQCSRPQLDSTYVGPRDDIERTLVAFWEELLGVERVGIQDNFFELGGYSLIAVRLIAKLKKKYKVEYPLSMLFDAPTVEAGAHLIREATGTTLDDNREAPAGGKTQHLRRPPSHSLLVPLSANPEASKPPFFLVAGMFGNVMNLRHLASHIGVDQPVYGIQARGLFGAEQPHDRFQAMAADYLNEIKKVQPQGPYFLGGFCGGGITAYEMAHQLKQQGEEVALLVFLDTFSPTVPSLTVPDRIVLLRRRLARIGPQYVLQAMQKKAVEKLARLKQIVSKPVRQTFLPSDFRSEIVGDAFMLAVKHYSPPIYAGNVVLFRPALHEAYALQPGRVVNIDGGCVDHANYWGEFIAGGIDVEVLTGDHDSIVLEPHVRALAAKLRVRLETAQAAATRGKVSEADVSSESAMEVLAGLAAG